MAAIASDGSRRVKIHSNIWTFWFHFFKLVEIDLLSAYLGAILHLSMLFGMEEALTIPENAFEAVLDFNA